VGAAICQPNLLSELVLYALVAGVFGAMLENTKLATMGDAAALHPTISTGPKMSLRGFRREEVRPRVKETVESVSEAQQRP